MKCNVQAKTEITKVALYKKTNRIRIQLKFSWNNSLLSDSCARGSQLINVGDCLSYTLALGVAHSAVFLIPSFLNSLFHRNSQLTMLSYFLRSIIPAVSSYVFINVWPSYHISFCVVHKFIYLLFWRFSLPFVLNFLKY